MWEAIRRFGLNYCDLPTMMWNVAVMLRIIALKIDRNSKPIHRFFYVLTAVCAVSYFYNYQVSMLWFVFVRCRETGDLLSAMMVLSTGTTSSIGITKLVYMYIHQDKIQSLVSDYLAYDSAGATPATNGFLTTKMRQVKRRALWFGIGMIGNGVIYMLQPLFLFIFTSERHLMFDGQVLYGLEPMLETPNYQIALPNIIIPGLFICFVVSTVTVLLIIITGYSEGRMLALSQDLRVLWRNAQQHYKENFDMDYEHDKFDSKAMPELNKYVREHLYVLVRNHATNIVLMKRVEDVFRDAIAAEFLLLSISLIADLLGGLETTYIIMPFSIIQVSMDCFTGQKLMDASIELEKAIFDCKWENFDASNMRTVLLMLQMSQKTLKLSAGGVATLNFECLMSLIKSVYSAYTTFHSKF